MPSQQQLMNMGITAAILFAAWKFAPNNSIKAAVLGVAGVVVAKQLPYVKTLV